jgi:hypothetical protein
MLVFTMPAPALVTWDRHLCLAWPDARYGDSDVLARCSAGGVWRPIVRVNRDRPENGHRQYLPRLGVSPGGRLDIVYLDRPDDLNRYNSTAYSYSTDGGATFRPPVEISEHVSDTRIGARYGGKSAAGQVEFGSRLGLLSLRHAVIAAWADTRNSTLVTTSQDIFVSRFSITTHRPWWAELPFAPLAAAVIVLAITQPWRRRNRRIATSDDGSPAPRPEGAAGPDAGVADMAVGIAGS